MSDYSIRPQNVATTTVVPELTCLNKDTSPAVWNTPSNQKQPYIVWKVMVNTQVVNTATDSPATNLAGQGVSENGHPINQTVASDGKYMDPVGHFEPIGGPMSDGCQSVLNAMGNNWGTLATTHFRHTQNYNVTVGSGNNAGETKTRVVHVEFQPNTNAAKIWMSWPT